MKTIENIEKKLLDVNVKLESNRFELRDIEEDVKIIKRMIEKMKEMENINTQKECMLKNKVAEIEVKIEKIKTKLNIVAQNSIKLNKIEKDLDNLQRETDIENSILKQYVDNGLALYETGRGRLEINIEKGFNEFEIEPSGCRGVVIKKAKIIMTSEDGLVSLKLDTLKLGQGLIVTGPYVYNGQTYFGSWDACAGDPIIGEDRNGIIRGAIMDNGQIKTVFGKEINEEGLKVTEAFINPKTNKLIFRYINDGNEFKTNIKIQGLGI